MGTPPIQSPSDSTEYTSSEQQQAPPSRVAPDPDDPPWGLLGAVGFVLLSFLVMALTQMAFLVPYAARRGVPMTGNALSEFAVKDPGAIFVEIVSIIPAHLITLGLAWLLVTRAGKYPFLRTLGWEWDPRFTFWRSAGLAVALLLVGTGIIWLTGNPENALQRLIQSSRAAALATAFAATFTAPLVEEIVFRGILYSALRRLVGAAAAVAFVLVLFAAIHVPQYWPSYGVIGTILLLSFVLTAIRAHTGKLLPCFVVHLIFNSIQAVLIVLNPYLERLMPEKVAPPPPPDPALLLEIALRLFGPSW